MTSPMYFRISAAVAIGAPRPGLEAIAEGVEVAVRADARIFVREPGAAEAFLRFEHDEARAGALVGEVVGAADAGDAGADDQDVEVLGLPGGVLGVPCCVIHRGVPVRRGPHLRPSDTYHESCLTEEPRMSMVITRRSATMGIAAAGAFARAARGDPLALADAARREGSLTW